MLGLLARNGISCFRNHGCSGVINCSVLADKRLRSGTMPVSCLMCAAAQFLKKVIPSHTVYDSKTSVLFLLFTRIVLQSPCKCKFSSPFNCSFQDDHIVLTYLPLKDQMAISQTCTFVHDVAAYNKNNSRLSTSNLSK